MFVPLLVSESVQLRFSCTFLACRSIVPIYTVDLVCICIGTRDFDSSNNCEFS